MSFDSIPAAQGNPPQNTLSAGVFPRRALTIAAPEDCHVQTVTVYLYTFNPESVDHRIKVDFHKRATTEELIEKILDQRDDFSSFKIDDYEIFETLGTLDGRTFKERRLDNGEYPVAVQTLWPRALPGTGDESTLPKTRFVMRQKGSRPQGPTAFVSTETSSTIDSFLAKFLTQPQDREYADLCMLPELTEQTLLDNLKDRFNSGHIYTYIGPILVAVNPFSFFPIYNPKYAKLYSQSRRLGALPPHIFAIADITYHNMLRIKESQCVVISGESGSGKTESTNFLLHHLTTLSQKGSDGSSVEQTLLSAGPVLEAFGNAVTVQNNNSSRFGKFIKVNYRDNGMVSGANVEIYLLEKSRIISQAIGERNYHVFYYLLEGASEEERKQHFLLQPNDYYYLNQNNFFSCEGINEKYEYERLKHSMEAVGFSKGSQEKIFGMISAVLLLGNIEFIKRPGYHSDENAYIGNEELIDIIAELLNIKAQQLHQALTMRRTVLRNDTVITRYNVSEAINTRDAMAKCLYNALFHWIVLRMNQALIKRDTTSRKKGYYIGILDIFGFEDVGAQWNSFEQLCINYANEHLQAYFNQHIFQFEQEEYLKENIAWTNIEYTDNTECVHLFQSKPYGLLRLIDEESNINNGTDKSMLDKLNTFLKGNEYYEIPHKKEDAFIIAHYAGKVKYQITGFREKNKDLMRHDVMMVLKSSKSAFVRELVGDDPVAVYRWNLVRCTFRAISAFKKGAQSRRVKRAESLDRLTLPDQSLGLAPRRGSDSHLSAFLRGELNESIVPEFCDTSVFKTIVNRAKKQPMKPKAERQSVLKSLQAVKELIGKKPISNKPMSVSRQFEYSLGRLMKTLSQATPYFIRCIKSNNEKIPNFFDDNIILRQLRYTGMLETVRIRRAGYSVRIEYEAFINQYRILLPKGEYSTRQDVEKFIEDHSLIENENVQYGKNKIFLRDAEKLLLDDHLHRIIMDHIYTLQRWFRAILQRKHYLKLKSGVIKLQAMIRGMIVRNQIRQRLESAILIQTNWRRFLAQRKYRLVRDTIYRIQAIARGNAARKRFLILRENNDLPCFHQGTDIQTVLTLPPESTVTTDEEFTATETEPEAEDEVENKEQEEVVSDEETKRIIIGESSSEEEEDEGKSEIDLDATFILEDTRLKLIGEADKSFHRRQSLATTASTSKLKMLRRAASTESDQIQRADLLPKDDSDTSESKSKSKAGIGFMRARRHLKALLTRKMEGIPSDSEHESLSIKSSGKKKDSLVVQPTGLHNFKLSRLHKSDTCTICGKTVSSIFAQGYKCSFCKQSFHKECSQLAAKQPCIPCTLPTESQKRPWEKIKTPRTSLSPLFPQQPSTSGSPGASLSQSNFNLTQTKQQTDPAAMIIESTEDLREFSIFIFKKQCSLEQEKKKKRETFVDALFKKSLKEFHMELIGYEAVLTEDKTNLKYRDLITTFEGLLTKVCAQEHVVFPTILGVNAFRGFLNEFMQQQTKRKGAKQKSGIIKFQSVRKKRRKSDVTIHNGHRFKLDFVHVPTYCEICNQFMWHAEKIFICMNCRLSCHKKCHSKVNYTCAKASQNHQINKFFGADLGSLVDDDHPVPIVLNKMLMSIEVRALFVEGIYRKSGALPTVRNMRKLIEDSENQDELCFDDVPIHVIATLVKSFFREMAEPLIPFELYENFLNVSEVKEQGERIRCLSVMVDMLPKNNKSVLDRLMYHLSRVAHQETVNRMSPSNLAVIFAPCILRRNIVVHAQEQLLDVQKQVICVQTLIEEKLRQYKATLNQIVEIEQASEKVTENLRRIDAHRRASGNSDDTIPPAGMSMSSKSSADTLDEKLESERVTPLAPRSTSNSASNIEAARQLFVEQLDFLDKEKEKLIQELPPLAPVASSEDLSSSEEHSPSPAGKLKFPKQSSPHSNEPEEHSQEYAIDLSSPPVFSHLPNSFHRTPGDVRRRLPSWASKTLQAHASPQDEVVFRLTFDDCDEV